MSLRIPRKYSNIGFLLVCSKGIRKLFNLTGAYISETVHPSLRASLVVVSPVLLAFGYFMVWGLSSVTTWRIIALISIGNLGAKIGIVKLAMNHTDLNFFQEMYFH